MSDVCRRHTRCTYIQFKEVIRACPPISNFHDICSQLPCCFVSLTCILHVYGTSVSFVYVFISCCVCYSLWLAMVILTLLSSELIHSSCVSFSGHIYNQKRLWVVLKGAIWYSSLNKSWYSPRT